MAQTASTGTASVVRAELARRRLSGRKLADHLGWSERTLRRRLAGESSFTVDELTAVAGFLGLGTGDLLPNDPERVA